MFSPAQYLAQQLFLFRYQKRSMIELLLISNFTFRIVIPISNSLHSKCMVAIIIAIRNIADVQTYMTYSYLNSYVSDFGCMVRTFSMPQFGASVLGLHLRDSRML